MEKGLEAGRLTLSVIVITKNEAAHIRACLDSVAFADEVIVLDSGSADDTVALAGQWGARVVQTPDWPGFGPQKNRALELARCDWVLSLDADERVTPELAAEIQALLRHPGHDAYRVARLSELCGRQIRHSGWWPDHVLRLFRRGTARFTEAAVHEKVVTQGSVGTLRHHLLHFPYPDLESLIAKANRYSTDAAAMMYARGKRCGPLGMLGHGIWTFIRIYFLRRGFLDGRQGLVLALFAASGSIFRYAKLMLFEQTRKGGT
ncbi:glycosyltransferase family 2 protein [Orrella sp. JC864]|uniref:glycosyltransferase family 2 protein n=1 Tax=Orrella sp. JC864 TaxID=3120298 RepID=UPI0012BBE87F